MLTASLLLAVFLGALVSGWHCALMCGGIAAAVERQGRSNGATHIRLQGKSELFYLQLIMHAGRLMTYVLLGALAACSGAVLWQQNFVPIQRPLFAITSLILLLMGLRLLRPRPNGSPLFGKWFGARMATYWAQYLGGFTGRSSRWFSGMVWGLVPCGLVYSVLPLAFLSGDVLTGAALMLAFGLGTLPLLITMGWLSQSLPAFFRKAQVRLLAGLLVLLFGLLGVYRLVTGLSHGWLDALCLTPAGM